jgi:hypothetical protein
MLSSKVHVEYIKRRAEVRNLVAELRAKEESNQEVATGRRDMLAKCDIPKLGRVRKTRNEGLWVFLR